MKNQKFIKPSDLLLFAEKISQKELVVVFTNGCFDLLHPGHIQYLAKARALGDILVVGLNTDRSVQLLKGKERPINPFSDRVIMLSALTSVDFIVGFEEETPINLIKTIKPQVLVKGGDYLKKDIVGADYVESYKGKVRIIPFESGYSSTALIEKIKKH